MSKNGKGIPYEQQRNPKLPWGYWITIDTYGDPDLPLIDDNGVRWRSLRSALWKERLSMGYFDIFVFNEQLEFLLAVLVAIDRTLSTHSEAVNDLFGGDWHRGVHYSLWLEGHGLIDTGNVVPRAKLTPEGRAIMAMLMATRDPELMAKPIGLGSLATYAAIRPEPDRAAMEQAIARAEASLPPMPIAFARHTVDNAPAIVLIGPARSRIAISETIWALQFDSEHVRDLFYRWLLSRADRWEHWSNIVQRQGAQALTRHFLSLRIAEDAERTGN
ncbi:hypothetical protein IP81_07395 [Novosphingobium sp. AAP83]|uniref:hypothetical protein n=1 Tax=Novosphingobium sp. AAP83 TaxID=1523425 RepID=UPI0006B8EB2C|nr:hypothetical protein [Novosphingobium sp. AAP83]KPF91883.1 hypothetical protein IP81_07395 [Novosphingobium sp. AAP83]